MKTRTCIAVLFFLISANAKSQDLIQQVSDSISEIKKLENQLEGLENDLYSKGEEIKQHKNDKKRWVQDSINLERKRPDNNMSDNEMVVKQFNEEVNKMNIRKYLLNNTYDILKTQVQNLAESILEMEAMIDERNRNLILLLIPHATCAKKLPENASLAEIEKCWSCFLREECAIGPELTPPIPGIVIPKRGAPELMDVLRKEQLRMAEERTPKIEKGKPAENFQRKNVNQAPPQKPSKAEAINKVLKFFKDELIDIRKGKFYPRTYQVGPPQN